MCTNAETKKTRWHSVVPKKWQITSSSLAAVCQNATSVLLRLTQVTRVSPWSSENQLAPGNASTSRLSSLATIEIHSNYIWNVSHSLFYPLFWVTWFARFCYRLHSRYISDIFIKFLSRHFRFVKMTFRRELMTRRKTWTIWSWRPFGVHH